MQLVLEFTDFRLLAGWPAMGHFPGETLAQPHRAIFDQSSLWYLYNYKSNYFNNHHIFINRIIFIVNRVLSLKIILSRRVIDSIIRSIDSVFIFVLG